MAKSKHTKRIPGPIQNKETAEKQCPAPNPESTAKKSQSESTTQEDTVFIRNLSFDTEEETLKDFINKNFGETVYCLVCKDKTTHESKGTAFAKFKNPQDAFKCLQEFRDRDMQTKFHLEGRNLIILPSISRDKIGEATKKVEKGKDKRNLNLAKEGRIHPQSEEAIGLSKSDLEKRKVLDTRKRELLKNLHNFVSDTRLCIHNLPPSVDDERLRAIFMKCIKDEHPGAKITECRVMRNKKGSGKLGTSKGFGFVAFSKHENALAALRNLNNKPDIFTKDKRPIVEFSIENMVALNKKKTRLVNSQRKNKTLQDKQQRNLATESEEKPKKKVKSKKIISKQMKRKSTVTIKNIDTSEQDNLMKKIKKVKSEKLKKKTVS